MRRRAVTTAGPVVVVVVLAALIGPAVAIPLLRGRMTGLFAPSLGLAVPFALVGAFLLRRAATTVVALLMALVGLGAAGTTLGAVLMAAGPPHPAARWVANLSGLVALCLLAPLFLLLPDGRLSHRRWQYVIGLDALVAAAFLAVAIGSGGRADFVSTDPSVLFDGRPHSVLTRVTAVLFVALLTTVVVSIGALVRRRRSAVGTARGQLTCLLFGGALTIALLIATIPVQSERGWGFAVQVVIAVPLPVAIGIAVSRYRLYDIDRIVSRTVTYAAVIVLLGGVYAGVLAGLSVLVPAGSGQVGVVVATLAVVLVEAPVTRRLRRVVDRRFNRARFDAEQVVAGFAARMRSRPDYDDVPAELLGVITRTVQPVSVAVWLAPSPGAGRGLP